MNKFTTKLSEVIEELKAVTDIEELADIIAELEEINSNSEDSGINNIFNNEDKVNLQGLLDKLADNIK